MGNSPLECTPDRVKDCRLFISTTNGTRSLQQVENAKSVLAAAFINRRAVVDYIIKTQPETVWIVGSGWEGSFSLEDTTCAGAIAENLLSKLGCTLQELAGNDEVISAIALFRQWQDNLLEMFHHASHGQRLLKLGVVEDLKYCAKLDILDVIPMQRELGVLVKNS